MRIRGDELLQASLEAVTGRVPRPGDPNIDRLARRSKFVIDSANLAPDILGAHATDYEVTPTGGSFTWGPGGDIDSVAPTEIEYWTVRPAGSDYDLKVSGYARLTPLKDWIDRTQNRGSSIPAMLYWPRQVDAQSREVLHYWPQVGGYTFRLYGQVPSLTEVRRGANYDLPQGVGNFIIRLLANDANEMLGLPPRSDLYVSLKAAQQSLSGAAMKPASRVTSPDWLDLNGRGDYMSRRHNW